MGLVGHGSKMLCYLCTFHLLDQSDRDLRYSLANLVAVIVGSPSGSNHLWYHLFSPEKLSATFMTGFLVRDYLMQLSSNEFV